MDLDHIPFIPGLELSRRYHDEAVRPILSKGYPGLMYAAGRLDGSSDVLGFDTPQSRDHDWGPRLTLFLSDSDLQRDAQAIMKSFALELPLEFYGYPTNFERHDDGTLGMVAVDKGPVNPLISIKSYGGFYRDYLDYDPADSLTVETWLSFPEQRLRTIRSGRIFNDDTGRLSSIRDQLNYYPHDIWLYLLAVAWRRIDQEEPFMGRAGDVGDDIGSRLITASQINNAIRLSFLMEREYAPYSKWLGTALSLLESGPILTPIMLAAWEAGEWQERQEVLSELYVELANRHNGLGLTPHLPATISNFHERPYQVIHSDRFVDALRNAIVDRDILELPPHLGGIDQFVNSTDVLSYPKRTSQFRELIKNLSDDPE
jgi:hypothetical protein